ncbi:hypothetical protein [Fluviicola sp.]|jgi:hypothetical protein|uniref:hypothetical protein n=1 Tax=Fluviicola sp. TaxID=1917219 RepID=UPI002827F392|nr:hypothetical protein [Fluviicola sp.]MDR0801941.1 hypothetical protein [Fluviicola sp.]
MKIKFNLHKSLLNLSVYCIIASSGFLAQKIESAPIPGAGRIVMSTQFEGLIGNKEIRSNVQAAFTKYNHNILVYENKKKQLKKDIRIKYNDVKYVPNGYFIKESKIVGYFIAGTKNSERVMLCLQEFDTELKPIGQPVEIIELPRAVDQSKLLDSRSGGMFTDKVVKEQNLVARYNKDNGTILFCFSLQLVKGQDLSYCKIILLNDNYKVLNTFEYKSASGENYIQATPQKIFENGDALVSISEGIKEYKENGSLVFKISKQAQIFVPANGGTSKELELMPDQERIINIKTAENLTKDGNVLYSILSSVYDKERNEVVVYIGLYTYNVSSEKLERKSYQYGIKEVFPNYNVLNTSSFYLKKIFNLTDGSILLWLIATDPISGYSRDSGHVFIKIEPNNQISWIKGFRKESISLPELAGAIDYFDTNGNLNLVFNFPSKKFKNNTLATCFGKTIILNSKITRVDVGSIPIVATVDISTGEIMMKKMSIEGSALGGILISESESLGENGKYRMHMMINKKLQFAEIDFNAD